MCLFDSQVILILIIYYLFFLFQTNLEVCLDVQKVGSETNQKRQIKESKLRLGQCQENSVNNGMVKKKRQYLNSP